MAQGQDRNAWVDALRALTWPVFFGALIWLAFSTRKGRFLADSLIGRINRVGAFGLLELNFSRDRAAEVKRALDFMFKDYRRQAIIEFNRLALSHKIGPLHERLARECIEEQLTHAGAKTYRCTIYVQDLVFEEALYQLLDYFPAGGGKGRIIPRRLGLVGRAFRSEQSLTQPAVPGDVDVLVVQWGMTHEEAARKNERHSFSCVLLKDAGTTVGGVYLDSTEQNAFKNVDTFATIVDQCARKIGLIDALSALSAEVAARGASIGFLEQSSR